MRILPLALLVLVPVSLVAVQIPRDDRVQWPVGHAHIAGIVRVADVSATPVRRAIVTLSGGGLPRGRSVITDERGAFSFDGLPAGRFELTATKPTYLTSAFGARRPGGLGTPIVLSVDQQMTDVVLSLSRGGVIAGTLRAKDGAPASGVPVTVVPAGPGARPVSRDSFQTELTDELGAYRFFGLTPGRYVVMTLLPVTAHEAERMPDAAIDDVLRRLAQRQPVGQSITPPRQDRGRDAAPSPRPTYGYAPTFYPGTSIAGDAAPIAIAVGEERTGVDFVMDLVPMIAIEVTVRSPFGEPPPIQLVMTPLEAVVPLSLTATPTLAVRPTADGRFKYIGVAPGRYRITARATVGAKPSPPTRVMGVSPVAPLPAGTEMLWAAADVVAADSDLSVQLTLQPALRLRGRVSFDATVLQPPADLSTLRITMPLMVSRGTASVNGTNIGDVSVPPAQVRTDGTFEFSGVLPGSYRISSSVPGSAAWWLHSAVVDGRDVLDVPFEIRPDSRPSELVLTFSDRQTEISGTLLDAKNQPAPAFLIVVLPADRALWQPRSRRVHSTRPGTDGRFVLRNLPGGDYLLAALTDADPADLDDMAFLEQVATAAIPFSLDDGEMKTQNVRIAY